VVNAVVRGAATIILTLMLASMMYLFLRHG
jgi:hypothetical protein